MNAEQEQPGGAATEAISAHDELDLTDEGFQVPQTNWQITSAEVEAPQPGQQRAVIEFTTEHDGVEYQVTDRLWLQYTGSGDPNKDELVTRIGRGQLKRLFIAALGGPVGTVAELQGKWISARGEEDENGFRRLRSIREPEEAADDTGEL